MPVGIAYRIDQSTGVSVSVWLGHVDFEEAAQHVADLLATPEWGAGGRILTDLSGVPAAALPDRDQIARLASAFQRVVDGRTQQAKWAFVANAAFMRASQFGEAIHDEVRSLLVFFDLASACIWLGVDRDAIRSVIESLRIEAQSQGPDGAD
jgi:hypothetical protein